MADFKVISILGPNIIETPGWSWSGREGKRVQIRGVKGSDEIGDRTVERKFVDRLILLLQDKEVQLYNAQFVGDDFNTIKCDVILRGVNIKNYFVDLQ